MIRRAVFAMLGAAAYAGAFADGAVPLSDDAMKEKIVSFVTLPSRLCGRATLDFRDELKSRKITNRSWFDGDTNRLARLICELAQTNDSRIATMMIMALGEYGTPAQLPFLYSCATNAVLAKTAVKSVLHAEGVTSNSVALVQTYVNITNGDAAVHWDHIDVFQEMINALHERPGEQERGMVFGLVLNHAPDNIFCPIQLDRLIISSDPSYRQSKRRLTVLRGVRENGVDEYDIFYVTNAINELVAYPEADLPD